MARNVAKMTAFLRPRLWMITCDTFLMDLGNVDSKRTILREEGTIHIKYPTLYRVSQQVSDLGWVDLDLGCSNTVLGQ